MTPIDLSVFAERLMAVERHLARVADKLPPDAETLAATPDVSDVVVLHLWQALQIVIDIAMSACVRLNCGTPSTYADAFKRLGQAGVIEQDLADRLARAAGFRNLVVHAYEGLDLARVFVIAQKGPADLRRFLAAIRDRS